MSVPSLRLQWNKRGDGEQPIGHPGAWSRQPLRYSQLAAHPYCLEPVSRLFEKRFSPDQRR